MTTDHEAEDYGLDAENTVSMIFWTSSQLLKLKAVCRVAAVECAVYGAFDSDSLLKEISFSLPVLGHSRRLELIGASRVLH